MANPFDQFDTPKVANPFDQFDAPVKPESERWKGGVLPVSEGPDGKPQFDSNAGLIGGLKRAFTTPGDVISGKVDLNTEEGFGRALELSGFASPVPPGIRAGRLGTTPPKVTAPTSEALKQAAREGYDTVRDMGVDYSTRSVTDMIGGLKSALERDGILGELAPKTHAIIGKFANPPEGSVVSIAGLEAARRAAGHAAKDFANPTDQLAARRLIQSIDEFIAKPDPNSVVAGPAAAAGEAISSARGNYAAAKRAEKLQGVEEQARLNADKSGSGFNVDNAVRQRANAVTSKPKESAGFTPDEIAALKDIIRGNPVRNTARTVGNVLGGGGGFPALVAGGAGSGLGAGIGTLVGGPLGATVGAGIGMAAPAVGMAAKTASGRMALGELAALEAATRARSPLYQEMLGAAPTGARGMGYHTGIMGLGTQTLLQGRQPQTMEQLGADPEALLRFLREGGA